MKRSRLTLGAGLALALFSGLAAQGISPQAPQQSAPSPAAAQPAPVPDLQYERFVLPNGLTVIVHEDHKAPIVAVNVWYHVGSKDEPEGRSGFAHLFEHLMFNGSEHYNDDYFKALRPVGATDLNGTTNTDRTNYFQNVPTAALDRVLFLESDRMGHLLPAIDQAKLDEQRGVVQNEKRQGENAPYGRVFDRITTDTYPAGHPYSWSVIGSMEDLNAATLEDVRDWFRSHYGPNNAVVVVAGDITPAAAREKMERWFGAIPPGPPVARPGAWIAKMTGQKRAAMEDRVPQPALFMVWNVPPYGDPETMRLDLVAAALAEGKNSRLYKRLVYDEQLATQVSAFNWEKELGSQLIVQVMARPGVELAKVEQITKDEIARFLREGPTPAELERAKMGLRADFVRSVERVGGFGGVSDVLASNQVYLGDPSHYKTRLRTYQDATAEQVKRVAADWLSDGSYVLEVHPYPQLKASGPEPDRSTLPPAPTTADTRFPAFTTETLANGMQLIVAPRQGVPVVNFQLLVGAGYAADPKGKAGLASLTADMLDEGTKTKDALAISDRLQRLGATLSTGATLDLNSIGMTALKENLGPSLDLLADVALNPAFAQADFARKQKEMLVGIQQEKVEPNMMALRVMPKLLYGVEHAYGTPFTGSGTEQTVSGLTPRDLAAFHDAWFKPNNASLIVVGAATAAEIKPIVERAFSGWTRGEVPEKNIAPVPPRQRAEVYLIDRPGSDQSVIMAGRLVPPRNSPDEIAVGVLNNVLGGQFVSRINMNLREDKHWSYGARTRVVDAQGQRPFIVVAPVQTDKTKESVQEVMKELRGIIGDRPVTPEELADAQASITLALPGRWETNAAVAGSLGEIVSFGLKHDYFDRYAGAIRALQLTDVQKAATTYVEPDRVVWVIVGDREKIEPGLQSLGIADIQLIDADGRPVGGRPGTGGDGAAR